MRISYFQSLQSTSPTLHAGEIHVWLLSLSHIEDMLPACAAMLSIEERLRSARFAFERDRRRYACCRGALRHLLSVYLGIDAKAVAFSESPSGKPFIAASPVQFNVSHSHEYAALCFSRGSEVGVDIEYRLSRNSLRDAAGMFAHPDEAQSTMGLPDTEAERALLTIWVRKEALFKAIGLGLSGDLKSVCVASGNKPGLTVEVEGRSWRIEDVAAPEGYLCAGSYAVR